MAEVNIRERIKHGSITVEAAFVMPVIIFAIIALIHLAFYLHDVCRIQATMDKSLHKESISVKHEADIETGKIYYEKISGRGVFYLIFGDTSGEETELKEYLQQELSKGLFAAKITEVNVDIGKFKIAVSVEAETQVILPFFQYLFDPYKTITLKGEYPVHNPAETVRRTEVILETGSSIKGVDELKEKLDGFLGSE